MDMDSSGRIWRDQTVGSEGRESKCCSSRFKTKEEGYDYIKEIEGWVGNEEYTSKFEDNIRRKTDKIGLVGATTRENRENDRKVGKTREY